ncbi:hypothetical protein KAH94_00815 [bacterium]|nr:hypothetical protein [bacterium]
MVLFFIFMTKKKTIEKEDSIIEYINKTYGKGKIFKLPEKNDGYDLKDFISSGSMCLNYIMTGDYRCGFPRRRPVEIYGNESVCKTTLALTVAKNVSKNKLYSLFCDVERGLNEHYARQLNIDPEYFYYLLSNYGEESFTVSEDLLNKFNFDLFIYDSVGAMRPRSIVEGGYDEKKMGDQAKLMGNAIIKMGGLFYRKNIVPIFINQLGNKIGKYGNPNETKGGKTLKFQLWIRLEVTAPRDGKIEKEIKQKQKGTLDDVIDEKKIKEKKKKGKKEKEKTDTVETGTIITIKTIKNKLFVPRRKCRLKLDYGKGFDRKFDFLEYLHMQNIAKRNGKSKIIWDEKSMLNSSFFNKYKEDKGFKKEIWERIEDNRKSLQVITEDEDFLD